MTIRNTFRLIGLSASFALLLEGCSQETLPDPETGEGIPVRFRLAGGLSGVDTDTDLEPMSRAGTGYNNFILRNSELAIYRKINGAYILQQFIYAGPSKTGYPDYRSISENDPFTLEELGLESSFILQPGDYRACVLLNGPYYVDEGQYPKTGEAVSSVIREPDIFLRGNSIRDAYFSYTDFEVRKTTGLEETNDQEVTFSGPLTRTASPVRFILDKSTPTEGSISIYGMVTSPDRSMPVGIATDGTPVYSEEDWTLSQSRSVNLPQAFTLAGTTCYFPAYGEDVKNLTSLFVPFRNDGKSVSLTLQIQSIAIDGNDLWTGNLEIPVEIRPNRLTSVVLKYADGDLTCTTSQELETIRNAWTATYPAVPFNYIEYMDPKSQTE